MKICFLDNSKVPYTSNDINSQNIRGGENIIIHLSNELSKLNNYVEVFNNCSQDLIINNVKWSNIKNTSKNIIYDVAFTNNDIKLFNKIQALKYVAFSHSIQSIEKFIRKGQLFSYMKHKPKIVLLGKYHKKNRNFFLRMFGSFQASWAVDNIFLESEYNSVAINNQAIFTSFTDRNLNLLIKIWKEQIYSINNNFRLLVTPNNTNYIKYNIFNREFGDKSKMLSDISSSRIFLIPGHKGELYCIAAEEARELCVPIVTLGIGCLKERVSHGKTGFVAKNEKEFADYTIQLFNDDIVWKDMKKNLLALRGSKKWNDVANHFLIKACE